MNVCADKLVEFKKRYEPWVSRNLECAKDWKPDPVDWSIVAESPPYPKNDEEWLSPRYIYRVREKRRGGQLLGAVLSGFLRDDISKWRHAKRLGELREARVFVLDVCEYPVNHLLPDRRMSEVAAFLEPKFKDRLRFADPDNIIVLGGQDPGEFGDTVRNGLEPKYKNRLRNDAAIPFPHGGGNNYANCRDGIRLCVEKTRNQR